MSYALILLRVLAIVGIALHAGLLVRHNSSVLAGHLQSASLIAALSEICRSGGAAGTERPDAPEPPFPGTESSSCPICKGCVSAAAVLPAVAEFNPVSYAALARIEAVGEAIAQRLTRVLPPARAPPLYI